MAIATTYTPATEVLEATGGTEGTPHEMVELAQADEDGTLALLAATSSTTAMTLTYQVKPGWKGAQLLDFVLNGTSAGAGDTVDVYGRDWHGASLSENIDVSGGDGTYTTTMGFSEVHHFDATGFNDGTCAVNQNCWGVVVPELGPETITDGSFYGWTGDDLDDWTNSTEDGTNYITEVSGSVRLVSDSDMWILQVNGMTTGDYYRISIDVTAAASGSIRIMDSGASGSYIASINAVGTYVAYVQAVSSGIFIRRETNCDITFDNVSVRKVTGGFDIRADLDVGDGSTSTYFTSLNESVYFEDGYVPSIKAAATLQMGELAGDWGEHGSYWSFDSGFTFASSATAVSKCYASTLFLRTGGYLTISNGTIDWRNMQYASSGVANGPLITGGTITLKRCYASDINGLFGLYVTPSAAEDLHVNNASTFGFFAASSMTIEGLLLTRNGTNNSLKLRNAGIGATVNALNPKGVFTPDITQVDGVIKEQYHCNIHVTDRDGVALESATVLCEDTDGNTLFSVSTDASGDIAQQTIDYKSWTGTSETLNDFYPYTITISKANYATLVMDDITPTTIDSVVQPLVLYYELLPALSEDDVTDGTDYGEDLTGNFTSPAVGDVQENVQYGVSGTGSTGTFVVPAESEVENNVEYGASAEYTGNVTQPAAGDVESGVQYGVSGTGTTGTFGVPAVGDVEEAVQYGAAGTEFTGTFGVPTEAQVQNGVGFGEDDTEFTGTFGHTAGAELATAELDHIRIGYELDGKRGVDALLTANSL